VETAQGRTACQELGHEGASPRARSSSWIAQSQTAWAKEELHGAFQTLKGLNDAKKKLIVDFVGMLPNLMQQVFRCDWVSCGFVRNGSYDPALAAPSSSRSAMDSGPYAGAL
jgi:hypothetical protein